MHHCTHLCDAFEDLVLDHLVLLELDFDQLLHLVNKVHVVLRDEAQAPSATLGSRSAAHLAQQQQQQCTDQSQQTIIRTTRGASAVMGFVPVEGASMPHPTL